MKPGYKTTEFWIIIGTFLASVLKTIQLPPWAYPVLIGLYEISRGIVKVIGKDNGSGEYHV